MTLAFQLIFCLIFFLTAVLSCWVKTLFHFLCEVKVLSKDTSFSAVSQPFIADCIARWFQLAYKLGAPGSVIVVVCARQGVLLCSTDKHVIDFVLLACF